MVIETDEEAGGEPQRSLRSLGEQMTRRYGP